MPPTQPPSLPPPATAASLAPLSLTLRTGFLLATYPPGALFGPRQLRDWELVWLVEGDAIYQRNGVDYPAPEGAMALCQPPATDGFRWDARRRTRHAYFHFDLVGTLPDGWPALNQWPVVRNTPTNGDLLTALFRHLLAWNGQGDPAQTQWLALSLLAAFVTGQIQASETGARTLPDAVSAALSYIARRLDEDPAATVALPDLAGAACVSPEYLCRLFQRSIGQSPMQTLRLARLERSVALLAHTNFSVAEIAAHCGFESPFHFSRLFRQVYGRSPRAQRQAIAAGEPIPLTRLLPR